MRAEELTNEARAAAMLPWDRAGGGAQRGKTVLYRSRVLDALTLAPPWLPQLVMGPLAVVFAARALGTLPPGLVLMEAALGALTWTLVEYLMHRFLFHARAESEAGRVLLLLVHGHHHVWPDDPRRVAASPIQFGSLALLFWGVFSLGLSRPEAQATFAGFLFAYLAYEGVHYASHHGRTRTGVLAWLRRYHMQHHHEDPRSRWGIGSPLWDYVFSTHRTKAELSPPERRA